MTDKDLTIRHAQKNQPWTVPYSDGVMAAESSTVPHILGTHTALHAMKTVGKLAAVFESMDHPEGRNANMPGEPTGEQMAAIRVAAADLVTAGLRLANLYDFDLEIALAERVEAKNGRGFEPRCKAHDDATGLQCDLAPHDGGAGGNGDRLASTLVHLDPSTGGSMTMDAETETGRKRCHVCDTGSWCTEGDFSCPVCASSYFRSEMQGGQIIKRRCKGHYPALSPSHEYTGCTFEWAPEDDAKYGIKGPADPGDGS